MNTMLVLNLSPELDEDLVDYLLSCEGVAGFTSYEVRGHGEHQGMSIAEKVSGRRKRLQFEIIINEELVPIIIAGLKESVGIDIVYWQQTITGLGRV